MKRGAFIAILVFVAIAGCGLVVWGESSDGTKQSDLGAAIFGGAIVGAALIVVERAWSAERTERRKDEVMDASATPDARTEDAGAQLTPSPSAPPAGDHHTYRVEFSGQQRDTSRVNAHQVRLRTFRDGDYLQFFTAVFPDLPLALRAVGGEDASGRLMRAVAEEALPEIRAVIARGELEGERSDEERIAAREVLVDFDAAVSRARGGTASVSVDDVIEEFEL